MEQHLYLAKKDMEDIEPPTFWLLDNLFYLLSHTCLNGQKGNVPERNTMRKVKSSYEFSRVLLKLHLSAAGILPSHYSQAFLCARTKQSYAEITDYCCALHYQLSFDKSKVFSLLCFTALYLCYMQESLLKIVLLKKQKMTKEISYYHHHNQQ